MGGRRWGFDSWLRLLPRRATCRVSWPLRSHHRPAPAMRCAPACKFPWIAPRVGPCFTNKEAELSRARDAAGDGRQTPVIGSWRLGFSLRKRSRAQINPHKIRNILLYPEEGKPSKKKKTVSSIFTWNFEVWDLLQNNLLGAGVGETDLHEPTVLEVGLIGARVSIILFPLSANMWTSS